MNRKRQPFISSRDARKIDLLLRSDSADKASQTYYRALALLNKGEAVKKVAQNLGVSRQTLSKWKKRYQTFGLEAPSKAGKRRPSTETLQASIVSLTNQAIYSGQALTAAKLAKRLFTKVDTVQQAWKQLGFPLQADGKAVATLAVEPSRSLENDKTRGQSESRADTLEKDRPAVRLADIAQEAGVSKATVSRALRGDPKISELTAQRIRTIADRQGYRPDPLLKALTEMRWKHRKQESAVAFLLEGDGAKEIHPNQELWKGFSQQANRLGFAAELHCLDDYPNYQSLSRVLYNRGIQGVAIGFFPQQEAKVPVRYKELLACLAKQPFSLVSASWRYRTSNSCAHIFPSVLSTWGILNKKIRHSGSAHFSLVAKTFADPLVALATQVERITPMHLVPIKGESDFREFEKGVRRVEPDLLVGRDQHYAWLLEMGYSIPGDIKFISREKTDPSDRRIAGIDPRMEDHGAECARYLDLLIRNYIRGLNEIAPEAHLAPRWMEGDSFPED